MSMKQRKTTLLLATALMFVACGKKDAPPAPAKPVSAPAAVAETKNAVGSKTARMMELLRAAYDSEGGDDCLLVDLPDVEQRDVTGSYCLEPVAMHELPDGRVALVANAQPADEHGEATSAHAAPGLLNVYLMHREAGGWEIDSRQENIASLGSFGQFGRVDWVSLGNDKPGFTVQHGGTWQGQTISYLSVFDLTERTMHDLTQGLPLFSTDEGICSEKRSCTSVEGKWTFEKREGAGYDDLVLHFTGHEENRAEDAAPSAPRVRTKLRGMARYKLDGQHYVLIEGENIVPEV